MQQFTIDTAALTAPVTKEDRQRYRGASSSTPVRVLGMVFAGLLPIAIATVLIIAFATSESLGRPPILIGMGVVAIALSAMALRALVGGGRKIVQRKKFAEANGFNYHQSEPVQRLRGVLFGTGGSRRNSTVFHMHGNLRLGNYSYTTGSGKNRTTHHWRYLEVPLPRNVPNLVLDSTDNNSIFGSNLPVSLARDQRIELEGDFSSYFNLYAPAGYGFDVRYLLPPDTMALIADNLHTFDLEFIDDRLMLVANGSWDLHKDEPWRFVEWVVNVLHPHLVDRTDRYIDERVAQPHLAGAAGGAQPQAASRGSVGSTGRRLKKGFPVGSVIFVAIIAAAVFLPRLLS